MNLEESDPGYANLVWEHTFKVIHNSASETEVNSYNSAAISMNGTGWKQGGDLNENGKLPKIIGKMVRNLKNEILPEKRRYVSSTETTTYTNTQLTATGSTAVLHRRLWGYTS